MDVSSISSDSQHLPKGDARRRDYPLNPGTRIAVLGGFAEGKLRIVEKPEVPEAYTISFLCFSTKDDEKNDFITCVKLAATSSRSEERVKKYPTEILVSANGDSNGCGASSPMVKRLVLFKQELPIDEKYTFHYPEIPDENHIKSILVDESSHRNVVMFQTDSDCKPCYLADENNQCDCKQVLGTLMMDGSKSEGTKAFNRRMVRDNQGIRLNKENPDSHEVHVCVFCGEGLVGGVSCGQFCREAWAHRGEFPFASKLSSLSEAVPVKPATLDKAEQTSRENRCCLCKKKEPAKTKQEKEKKSCLDAFRLKKKSKEMETKSPSEELKEENVSSLNGDLCQSENKTKCPSNERLEFCSKQRSEKSTCTREDQLLHEDASSIKLFAQSMPSKHYLPDPRDRKIHFLCQPYVIVRTSDKQTETSERFSSLTNEKKANCRCRCDEDVPFHTELRLTNESRASPRKRFYHFSTTLESSDDTSQSSNELMPKTRKNKSLLNSRDVEASKEPQRNGLLEDKTPNSKLDTHRDSRYLYCQAVHFIDTDSCVRGLWGKSSFKDSYTSTDESLSRTLSNSGSEDSCLDVGLEIVEHSFGSESPSCQMVKINRTRNRLYAFPGCSVNSSETQSSKATYLKFSRDGKSFKSRE